MEFREIDSEPMVGKVEVGDFFRYPLEVGRGDQISWRFHGASERRGCVKRRPGREEMARAGSAYGANTQVSRFFESHPP